MVGLNDDDLVRQSTEDSYSSGSPIWPDDDLWNVYKRAKISNFVEQHALPTLKESHRTLNVGSGGDGYPWLPPNTINVDLFFHQVEKLPHPAVADIRRLPFPDFQFDVIVCTGSVVNYTSIVEAMKELHRVLRRGGHVIFDFESSSSFEHLGRHCWNRAVARAETFYGSRTEHLWLYSPSFVADLLLEYDLEVLARESFHIASSAMYRLGLKQDAAAWFARFDHLCKGLSRFADDHIILSRKTP